MTRARACTHTRGAGRQVCRAGVHANGHFESLLETSFCTPAVCSLLRACCALVAWYLSPSALRVSHMPSIVALQQAALAERAEIERQLGLASAADEFVSFANTVPVTTGVKRRTAGARQPARIENEDADEAGSRRRSSRIASLPPVSYMVCVVFRIDTTSSYSLRTLVCAPCMSIFRECRMKQQQRVWRRDGPA